MDQRRTLTRMDVSALHAVADQWDTAVDLIDDAVRQHLAKLAFDGSVAGRAHAGCGDALRAVLYRLAGAVAQWSQAAREIATTLRFTADRYLNAELGAAARLG
ncbi:MAG: ESX-1 secretion-associated protein [Mycobacteriaceae bacterium]|nr:ESX-1 secretion-associated protein [Mycobacteriaceae bacterium]